MDGDFSTGNEEGRFIKREFGENFRAALFEIYTPLHVLLHLCDP